MYPVNLADLVGDSSPSLPSPSQVFDQVPHSPIGSLYDSPHQPSFDQLHRYRSLCLTSFQTSDDSMATSPILQNGTISIGTVNTASTSPASSRPHHERKRTLSNVGFDSSPDAHHGDDDVHEDGHDDHETKRRPPGVKRACNECRQQKLRCDVQQDPFRPCARCTKHNLACRIDVTFKRIGKRSRQAEMEREIQELRAQVEHYKTQLPAANTPTPIDGPPVVNQTLPGGLYHPITTSADHFGNIPHETVSSLLELKQGSDFGRPYWYLGEVGLLKEQVYDLFEEYFAHYHPFLPLLPSPTVVSPETYFESSKLLFWTVITIAARRYRGDTNLLNKLREPLSRLVWDTVSKVSQNYHDVKALCLLCTWPLPTSSTATDPTLQFCGLMMAMAMQIGLHQPSHAQDFSRARVQLRQSDIHDRLKTWIACNVVAQSISTGYGQPPMTDYDSCFSPSSKLQESDVPAEFRLRRKIERSAYQITREIYSNKAVSILSGVPEEPRKASAAGMEATALDNLEAEITSLASPHQDIGLDILHFRAVRLHLNLYALFDNTSEVTYRPDLQKLYWVAVGFLRCAFDLEQAGILLYATNYIMQMMLAAGFTLFKLLNSSFRPNLPVDEGEKLFYRTVEAIRKISVANNDLPQRLAEVLAQLWRDKHKHIEKLDKRSPTMNGDGSDDSLQIKLRGRMSMSVVFDSVWRWREKFQGKGPTGNLDAAVNNPTDPEASSSSTPARNLGPQSELNLGLSESIPDNTFYADSYEFFDPMSWILGGQMDTFGPPYTQSFS